MARTQKSSIGRSLATGLIALGGRKFLEWWGARDGRADNPTTTADARETNALAPRTQRRSKLVLSAVAVSAVSFFLWPVLQLLLALGGFGLGALGLVRAQSPRVSGAGLALLSMVAAVVSFVVALFRITY